MLLKDIKKYLPKDFKSLDFDGLVVNAVNLESLNKISKKASAASKDNPEGNSIKYESLKKNEITPILKISLCQLSKHFF